MSLLLLLFSLFLLPLDVRPPDFRTAIKLVAYASVASSIAKVPVRRVAALLWMETTLAKGTMRSRAGALGPGQLIPDPRNRKGLLLKTRKHFGPVWLWESWVLNAIACGRKIAYFKEVCGRLWENCYNGSNIYTGTFRAKVIQLDKRILRAERRFLRDSRARVKVQPIHKNRRK